MTEYTRGQLVVLERKYKKCGVERPDWLIEALRIANRAYKQANKEKVAAQARRYHAKHREYRNRRAKERRVQKAMEATV